MLYDNPNILNQTNSTSDDKVYQKNRETAENKCLGNLHDRGCQIIEAKDESYRSRECNSKKNDYK